MKKLPKKRVIAIERAYKSAKGKQGRRYHALWLLARGYTREQVREIIGVSKSRLGDWVTSYHKHGLKGLRTKPQLGNHRYLKDRQKAEIKELINHKEPRELGYKGRFWNTSLLKGLIKDRYGIEYKSDRSYQELFKWCGFSYHKPDKVNKKRNAHMVKRFEDELKKDSGGIKEKIAWYW